MAPSAILERVRRLERRGIIRGYEARLHPEELGFGLLAFVQVKTIELPGETTVAAQFAATPGVLEVHHVAGDDCYLLKVRVADTKALSAWLRDHVGKHPSVQSTKTIIVLETLKEAQSLPLTDSR